jgi:hypothetical protein
MRSEVPYVRAPNPFFSSGGGSDSVVVEDGSLVSCSGGADAFAFSRRFMSRLEEVQRVF